MKLWTELIQIRRCLQKIYLISWSFKKCYCLIASRIRIFCNVLDIKFMYLNFKYLHMLSETQMYSRINIKGAVCLEKVYWTAALAFSSDFDYSEHIFWGFIEKIKVYLCFAMFVFSEKISLYIIRCLLN